MTPLIPDNNGNPFSYSLSTLSHKLNYIRFGAIKLANNILVENAAHSHPPISIALYFAAQ